MTEHQQTINLNPVFIVENKPDNIIKLNSFFLYIFLFLEISLIILLFYYFFKTELIFIYYYFFQNNTYSEEDKQIYNNYMYNLKSIITADKTCKQVNQEWYPIYNSNREMLSFNKKPIIFKKEEQCKLFLNL